MSTGIRLPGTPDPMHYWAGSGGLCLAGDAWGDPGGPLVILMHGGGQTRHAWKGTGEQLGRAGYRVIAYDARGHGDSEWAPDGDYDQDTLVEDLKCLVSAQGNRRPALVGASMGGGIGLVAAGEDRIDATALVLVDIAPRIEADGVRNIHAFMGRNPNGFDSLEAAADAISCYQPHRERTRNLAGLAKNLRRGTDGRYKWHWDPAYLTREYDLDTRQRRLQACACRLQLPTLLIRGALSDLLSEEGAADFLATCPHSEYVDVAEAAHMVAGDRNDLFGTAVIEFLFRMVPPQGTT